MKVKKFSKADLQKSFSILEIIFVIFIFNVGMLAIVTLVFKNVLSIGDVKMKLTASYLAQEGIEITRNIRDSNWLEQIDDRSFDWNDGLATEGQYLVDYQNSALLTYEDKNLNIDNSGLYSYSTGIGVKSSVFKRIITISEKTANSFKVSSQVFWQTKSSQPHIEVIEYIFNWK